MSTNQITHLNKQPFIPLLYAKAVLNSIIKTATNTWSTGPFTQQYNVSGQSINSNNLQRYIQCCRYRISGFKSTIIHCMLAKARVLAQLETFIDIQHISIDVQFKSAIFLPAQVCLNVAVSPQNNTFSLTNANNRVTHLSGVISPLLNKTN